MEIREYRLGMPTVEAGDGGMESATSSISSGGSVCSAAMSASCDLAETLRFRVREAVLLRDEANSRMEALLREEPDFASLTKHIFSYLADRISQDSSPPNSLIAPPFSALFQDRILSDFDIPPCLAGDIKLAPPSDKTSHEPLTRLSLASLGSSIGGGKKASRSKGCGVGGTEGVELLLMDFAGVGGTEGRLSGMEKSVFAATETYQ